MITFHAKPDWFAREPWYMVALGVAQRLHLGQTDKAGTPYWLHLQSVARRLADRFPDATQDQIEAALLHDVLEDTSTPANQLRGHGVRPRVVQIVQAVTRDKTLPYLEWIWRIAASGDVDAIRVKLADNLDNSDPARPGFPGQEAMMEAKYRPARKILEAALR